jgi:hypothetical protein
MTADEHRYTATVAYDVELYHVVHPTDPDRDEWTQNYILALAGYFRFVRDFGDAHLHVERFRADGAECLKHPDVGTG